MVALQLYAKYHMLTGLCNLLIGMAVVSAFQHKAVCLLCLGKSGQGDWAEELRDQQQSKRRVQRLGPPGYFPSSLLSQNWQYSKVHGLQYLKDSWTLSSGIWEPWFEASSAP